MLFYLGTHKTQWLDRTDAPLFVSHRSLRIRKGFPKATCRWALDSGGFTEISTYGQWMTQPQEYVDAVQRYAEVIGNLDWVAPMDWMCEPPIVAKTGLSVLEHQRRTIQSYEWLSPRLPQVIPVLQGWELPDYQRHVEMYAAAGIDLAAQPVVGVGSVCRRQATSEIGDIFRSLHDEHGLQMHGFGVKTKGVQTYGQYLTSSDSMAWSFGARFEPPMPGHTHKACNNCLPYALRWRARLLEGMI